MKITITTTSDASIGILSGQSPSTIHRFIRILRGNTEIIDMPFMEGLFIRIRGGKSGTFERKLPGDDINISYT